MQASQVIELAREWVNSNASQMPGFCGAHLMGGINYAPKEAPFAPFKDVDMNIVFQGSPEFEVHDLSYKGLILEYGSISEDAYRSADAVLANPELASNLAVNSILADPTGRLAALQVLVAQEYPRRQWVRARCEVEKQVILSSLEALRQTASPSEALLHAGNLVSNLAGLIAVASLVPPTHRRGLVIMKGLLEAWGRPDLQEAALSVLGYAHLTRAQVEAYQQVCARAFDLAVQVTAPPSHMVSSSMLISGLILSKAFKKCWMKAATGRPCTGPRPLSGLPTTLFRPMRLKTRSCPSR
jgi:hypothetical protein